MRLSSRLIDVMMYKPVYPFSSIAGAHSNSRKNDQPKQKMPL
jgi:hypothetical protein